MNFNEIKTNKSLQQIILYGAILILLLLLCVNSIVKINSTYKQISLKNQECSILQANLDSLIATDKDYDLLLEKLSEYEGMLPKGYNQDEILTIIQELCLQYNCVFSQIIFDSPTQETNIYKVDLSLNLEGNYLNVMSLLDKMMTQYRIMSLNEIVIESNKDGNVSVKCLVSVYYR